MCLLNLLKKTINPNPSPTGKIWFGLYWFGAGDRTRTGTLSPAVDFESTTSTNSITPAGVINYITIPASRICFSLSGFSPSPVAVPGVLLGANACVAHRPQPLPRVAPHASGGAPLGPQFHHTGISLHSIHHLPENSKCNFPVIASRFGCYTGLHKCRRLPKAAHGCRILQ